jgi:phospholipase D
MKTTFTLALVMLLGGCSKATEPSLGANKPFWEVHFSPKGGCEAAIAAFIDSAKTSVRMQAYSFTDQVIVDALLRAQAKKLDAAIILDNSNLVDPYSKLPALVAAKFPTWGDAKHVIAHNKVIIVDKSRVETGSFNYTVTAERGNADNCLFLANTPLAMAYYNNWVLHQSHSVPLD